MRRAAFERDWTKGSIIRNLLSLSWPIMVGNSLNMIGPTIDMIWVGRLGAASIAGVGVSGMAVMAVNSLMMGLFMGLRAMVARFIGASNPKEANHVAQQALVISVACSIIMAAIGIFFAEPILILLGVGPDVVSQGVPYLRINFIGMVTMTFRIMTEATMQASGDSRTPMWIAVFFRLFHVALCPFLIFGLWLFPRMGVSGAALTDVISQGIGAALGLWFLFTGRTRLRLTLRNFHFDGNIIWRMIKIGIPASVMGVQRSLGQLVLMWFIVPFGTFAVAAHTLCQRVEMFIMMPAMGLGMGAGVLAGQNLGARQPKRAERGSWLAVGVAEGFMIGSSVAVLLWAESIIGIFGSEPGVVEVASTFLRIAAAGFLVFSLEPVLMQCLSSVGDTLPPMLATLLSFWLVQIPLAFFLPRVTNLGVYGVRWAMVAGMATAAIAYTIYFRLGRWKRKKV